MIVTETHRKLNSLNSDLRKVFKKHKDNQLMKAEYIGSSVTTQHLNFRQPQTDYKVIFILLIGLQW